MKVLIAIVTCHAYRDRADAQRSTWIKEVPPSADVRFFLGDHLPAQRPDEVLLPVDDGYRSLPAKTQAMLRWAIAQGYDFVFKCDDDTYVRPDRLLSSGFERHDYAGRLRGPSGEFPAPYASGFAYWLSAKATAIVASADLNGDIAEDRFVGNTLHAAGVSCHADYRYVVTMSKRSVISGKEGPRQGNIVIAAAEYASTELMNQAHYDWQRTPSRVSATPLPFGQLDRICIMIKTFLRDGYLLEAVRGIEATLPETKMVIVDDGYESRTKIAKYAELRSRGHACAWLPFDSGFGAKANASLAHCDREYVLVGSDDFDFSLPEVRPGIERLIKIMDALPEVGIASGRVDGRHYEGFIERGEGYIKEIRLGDCPMDIANGIEYKLCDLTVNYSLLRRSMLGMDKVHWHAEWKIGGDHFTFFDDAKKAGWKIAFVPGVNIRQMPFVRAWQNEHYAGYRARARHALPSFFKMQGITKYIGFDGRVDEVRQ